MIAHRSDNRQQGTVTPEKGNRHGAPHDRSCSCLESFVGMMSEDISCGLARRWNWERSKQQVRSENWETCRRLPWVSSWVWVSEKRGEAGHEKRTPQKGERTISRAHTGQKQTASPLVHIKRLVIHKAQGRELLSFMASVSGNVSLGVSAAWSYLTKLKCEPQKDQPFQSHLTGFKSKACQYFKNTICNTQQNGIYSI